MALRFALLKDLPRFSPPSYHARALYEVFYVDLPDDETLVRYLRRPDVASYCETVLSPLRDVVMLARDRFYVSRPRPRDAPWVRKNLLVYLQLLVRRLAESITFSVLMPILLLVAACQRSVGTISHWLAERPHPHCRLFAVYATTGGPVRFPRRPP